MRAVTADKRLPALLALAVPVLVGAAWMALAGAPSHYPLVNLGALLLIAPWLFLAVAPHTRTSRVLVVVVMIAIMMAAIIVGPKAVSITGHPVYRWFPLGPLALNTGALAVPLLALVAARNAGMASPVILAGTAIALLQPDAATGLALTFAAIGIHHVTRDWRVGVAAIIAFVASLVMAMRGELPPQPFVEQVLIDSARQSVALAVALALALVASFCLILFATRFEKVVRFALAGALLGFAMMALMSSYPAPLIGYGPSAILGLGLALGVAGARNAQGQAMQDDQKTA